MNTRPLSQAESDNLTALNEAGVASTLLFITATGLEKSILDATEPMREMLHRAGIHCYATQSQGDEGKVTLKAFLVDGAGQHEVKLSLYRPKTKQGDPRMWFYSLGGYAKANDVMAVFVLNKAVHAINLTRTPLAAARGTGSALDALFRPFWQKAYSVSSELLQKLKDIAALGPLRAECVGDTAVGRSIETALGIPINSEREPDYKGIEIKSGRSSLTGRETRANLFACVPDWKLSNLKSSAAILDRFGYQRGQDFKLYCTVTTRGPNSQGLQLTVDSAQRWLREIATKPIQQEIVIWKMLTLEERLKAKHPETFWVKVQSEFRSGKEYFLLKSVTHTRNPNLPQMERMLVDGTITLDHLIKRQASGRTAEKGPLFKIERGRIRELFLGEPKEYSLIS
jgi:MvaI/BcnI restriction endonuclease family